MFKILYIIPGFGEKATDAGYKSVATYAKDAGYEVVRFNPTWNRRAINNWATDFRALIEKAREGDRSVIGFSLGAYIAVLASQKVHFDKMILCSLSPYFKRDIKHLPTTVFDFFGKKKMEAFAKNNFPHTLHVKKVYVCIGDKDFPYAIQRNKDIYKSLTMKKRFYLIPNTGHDINSPRYISRIKEIIKKS